MWSGLRRSNSSTEIPARAAIEPAPSPDWTTIDEPSAAAVALDGVVSADSVASSFTTCLEELDALVEDDFLYVNDKSVDEAYISKGKSAYLATVSPGNFFTDDFSIATLTDNKQTKIEKGQYLVLNDNRRNTDDSRKFGLIDKDQIKGVISFRLYPLSRFGFVDVD